MSDNRTNEPNQNETKSGQEFGFTQAQVEAAAEAMYQEERGQTLEGQSWPRWHELCEDNPWSSRCGHLGSKIPYLTLARAALMAAAGAAPQAEMPGRQELGQTIRNKFNEARGRSGVDPWALADLILEEHPALAAPVLPSSPVDEAPLAEVINAALDKWEGNEPSEVFVARAVAEWLKEQGR